MSRLCSGHEEKERTSAGRDFEAPALSLDELRHLLGAAGGMPVNHEHHEVSPPAQEVPKEHDEGWGVEPTREDLVPELAPGVHGGDRIVSRSSRPSGLSPGEARRPAAQASTSARTTTRRLPARLATHERSAGEDRKS